MYYCTTAEMRAREQAMIASGIMSGRELMERAGAAVVKEIRRKWAPSRTPGGAQLDAIILCGPGNIDPWGPGNEGGDGYVIARLLKAAGWNVRLFEYGDAARLHPDAAAARAHWVAAGEAEPWHALYGEMSELAALLGQEHGAPLLIDALFGTGLRRPLSPGLLAELAPLAVARSGMSVSVDIVSGFCADSGRWLCHDEARSSDAPERGISSEGPGRPWWMRAEMTVVFDSPKVGFALGALPDRVGEVVIADIGLAKTRLPEDVDRAKGVRQIESGAEGLGRRPRGHKYDHGHALILSGGVGRGGAARLAARAALRVGAGAVTVGCPPAAVLEHASRLDAVMVRSVKDAEALTRMLEDKRINALALGMGLGTGARSGPRARALVEAALAAPRPTVLDADALTVFADDPEALFALLHPGCVLTPHMGEFARLFPDIAARFAAPPSRGPAMSKLDAAREAAARAGCAVLLKGPDTVIADRGGTAWVHSAFGARAVPWLATAGAGDVLAGLIAGIAARGRPMAHAAIDAVAIHTEAARLFGPGLIAEDLPDLIPRVLRGETA